jgi:hypothetical protein
VTPSYDDVGGLLQDSSAVTASMATGSGCGCACQSASGEFDATAKAEHRLGIALREFCTSNQGSFITRRSAPPRYLDEHWVGIPEKGVYLLWTPGPHCPAHAHVSMEAFYVGKGTGSGSIGQRLYSHWEKKDFAPHQRVYFSYVEMLNRHAKYYEQLFLDTHRFPGNRAETSGRVPLRWCFQESALAFTGTGYLTKP